MNFEERIFYRLKCSGCPTLFLGDETEDYTYFREKLECVEVAEDSDHDWHRVGDEIYCPECMTWCESCDEARVAPGEACPECGKVREVKP